MSAEQRPSRTITNDSDTDIVALADKMDLVGMYLEEVVILPLTAEEEKEFARRVKKGAKAKELLDQGSEDGRGSELLAIVEDGEVARQYFTEANLRLVVWVAKKYPKDGLSFLELIQEGNFGLMKAVGRFDPNRGNRFATYAVYLIKKYVKKGLSDKSRIIRLPMHICDEMPYFHETIRQLEQRLGRKSTAEEVVAAVTKLSSTRAKRMMSLPKNPVSLDETLGPGEDTKIIELIEDESAEVPAESAERKALREKIEELLLLLPAREAKVIRLWLEGHLLREIGDMFGLSRERVRQLKNQALRRLRGFPGTEELRVFLY